MAEDPNAFDIRNAVTLPNGDLYLGIRQGYQRPDTINAPEPMKAEEQPSVEEAQRFAAASRPRTNFEMVQDAINEATEG